MGLLFCQGYTKACNHSKTFIMNSLKLLFLLSCMFMQLAVQAQEEKKNLLKRITEKTKTTSEQRAENTGDKIGNKIGDKADAAVDSLLSGAWFKKKKKPNADNDKNQGKNKTKKEGDADDEDANGETANGDRKANVKNGPQSVGAYGKFDFVAGEKQLYFDNFDRLEVGDFPAEMNTNASGEVVKLENKEGKWLRLSKNGSFVPDAMQKLPENCTIEFQVGINADPSNNMSGFGLNFTTIQEDLMKDAFFSKGTSIVYLHPGAAEAGIFINPTNGPEIDNQIKMPQWDVKTGEQFVKVSIWRQKGRLRVYMNEDKIIDVPRFFTETGNYGFAFFRSFFNDCDIYLTNLRYAVAGADTRNKLITEGRFSTNEILFDVNSDKIKPESNTILSEIGKVLSENATVNIKIIGHTDNDGDAAANMVLSKKRAEAVKMRLVYGFGIDEARILTDGKGASVPLNANKTPEEKAINRRVEFIKL